MWYLQKERKGSKCEAQNMPGFSYFSFYTYTPTYPAGTFAPGIGSHRQ